MPGTERVGAWRWLALVEAALLVVGSSYVLSTRTWSWTTNHDSGSTNDAALELVSPEGRRVYTVSQLEKALRVGRLQVRDPGTGEPRTYEGFWLDEVLKLGGMRLSDGDLVVLHCIDGYAPTAATEAISSMSPRGLLAIREPGVAGGFHTVRQGKQKLSPAPFYLVWGFTDGRGLDRERARALAKPWPYQLKGIELVSYKATQSRVFPRGATEGSAALRGFERFRDACLKCHSINLQGGVLGPEFNVPRNITEYRDRQTLVGFIKNASLFRAHSAMPSFDRRFTDSQIDEVIAYLAWMKDHKQPER